MLRIIRDPGEVARVLQSKDWVKQGRIWHALAPLLGEGLILASGEEHRCQRAKLGGALNHVGGLEDAVSSFALPTGEFELGPVMLDLVEHVVLRCIFNSEGLKIAAHIRAAVAAMPLRLLGFPAGQHHIAELDRAMAQLPTPAWMGSVTAKQRRDQLLTLYVASVETTAARLTWTLCGLEELAIWFLPRQHVRTGDTAILLLSPGLEFGAGVRKCVGERLAVDIERIVTQALRVRVLPGSDFRRRWGITRWPRRAWVRRVP